LVSGLAFAPWWAVYAVLRLWLGWTHLALALGFLACGTVSALFVWRHVEKRLVAGATPMNDPLVFRMTASYAPDFEAGIVLFDVNDTLVQLFPTPLESVGAEVQVFSERFEPVARSAPRHTQILELTGA